MEELKPCPFCGSTDVHITQSYPHYVYCLNCNMMVQLAGKAWEKDMPELIKAWNARGDNAQQIPQQKSHS